jgi:hypothetical protein
LKNKQNNKRDKKLYRIIFATIIVAVILLPVWIWCATHYYWIDVSNTGQIGDTIGGLTSPIIGLIGSILIYISFREQLKANAIQIKTLKKDKRKYRADRFFDIRSKNLTHLQSEFLNIEIKYPIDDKRDENEEPKSSNKKDFINAIDYQYSKERKYMQLKYNKASSFISHRLMIFDQLSVFAGYEIQYYLTHLNNNLLGVKNEIERILNENRFVHERTQLIELYDDYLTSVVMPILNGFVQDRKRDDIIKRDSVNESIKRIVDLHLFFTDFMSANR